MHRRQFLWMHALAMCVIVAARRKRSCAEWTREFPYARVLDHMIDQCILQFECFAAHITTERFALGVMHSYVIQQTLTIQCRIVALGACVSYG